MRFAAVLILTFSITYLFKTVVKQSGPGMQNDEMSEIIVEYGKSAKLTLTDETAVIITKGTMSILHAQEEFALEPFKVDINRQIAWMNRELILECTPLNEVVDQLQRWYNLNIELPSPV